MTENPDHGHEAHNASLHCTVFSLIISWKFSTLSMVLYQNSIQRFYNCSCRHTTLRKNKSRNQLHSRISTSAIQSKPMSDHHQWMLEWSTQAKWSSLMAYVSHSITLQIQYESLLLLLQPQPCCIRWYPFCKAIFFQSTNPKWMIKVSIFFIGKEFMLYFS